MRVKKISFFLLVTKNVILIPFFLMFSIIASAQIIPSKVYVLKNVGSQKVMDVAGGSNSAKTQIWQYDFNLTNAQKFTFNDLGNSIYNIVTNSELFLSLQYKIVLTTAGRHSSANNNNWLFLQDDKYINNCSSINLEISCPKHQQWKLINVGNNTYYIESVTFPGKVLQPYDYNSQSAILLADKNNSDKQKWIIDTLRKRPSQVGAYAFYGPLKTDFGDNTPLILPDFLVDLDAGDVQVTNGEADINFVCPQHRSVGEEQALDKPNASYEILEGTVVLKEAGISGDDFPTSHYTHDFCFKVKPDPEYDYLLGAKYTSSKQYPNTEQGNKCRLAEALLSVSQKQLQTASPGQKPGLIHVIDSLLGALRNCSNIEKNITVANNFQKIIEVEWESGLGQDGGNDNPAKSYNSTGNSFGFFTAGHTSEDVIWNWPTVNDRVHIEGIWIWDRGHNAPTEIHPPHFAAVQRKLPVSLIIDANGNPVIRNQADDEYIGTRVDVFASADGTAMWNNKHKESFAQTVNMKRKDYTFRIQPAFKKPISLNRLENISLQCKFLKQKPDNFPADPIIKIENGIVTVTVPWHTSNVSNDAIFARTFVVYWQDVPIKIGNPSNKVLAAEKPKLYKVDILSVELVKPMDGNFDNSTPGNHGYGDFRIFCNVGNNWIFLNEFDPTIDRNNILESGLGKAMHVRNFQINKSFNVYISNNSLDALRIAANGWEADGSNYLMGHIINEYSRDPDPINKFFGSNLVAVYHAGEADDGIGSIDKMFTSFIIDRLSGVAALENIPKVLKAVDGNNNNVYDITYQIKEIPFSSTFTKPTSRTEMR